MVVVGVVVGVENALRLCSVCWGLKEGAMGGRGADV